MIGYTKLSACRSTYINTYFGDATAPCGICDNCLKARGSELSTEEFKKIALLVEQALAAKPLTAPQLIASFSGFKKEKVWKVIEFLQAEKKLQG